MPNVQIAIIAAAALLLLLAIVFVAVQNRRSRREREKLLALLRRENEGRSRSVEQLNHTVEESVRRMAEFSGAVDARMEALTRQNNLRLEEMRRMVGERLEGRLSESFKLVNAQLADVLSLIHI